MYSTVILVASSGLRAIERTLSRLKQPIFSIRHFWTKYVALSWLFHALTPIQPVDKGYPSLITDPAPLLSLGESSQIDSVQNVILIRADSQRGWDNYSLAVNPDVCDHFHQCVLNKMKGEGEPRWDHYQALGDGMLDLSRLDIWGGERGQGHLEFELAHRLHGFQGAQEFCCYLLFFFSTPAHFTMAY